MAKSRSLVLGGVVLLLTAMVSAQGLAQNDALLAGIKELNAGDYAAAVSKLREAVDAQPQDAEAYMWLGRAIWATGAADEAVEAWLTALRLAPVDSSANVMAKQCLNDAKLIAYARSLYEQGLYKECADPLVATRIWDRPGELSHDFDYLLAWGYFELNRPVEARSYCLSVLNRHPVGNKRDNAELLLGRLEAQRGAYKEALGLYEKVISAYPGTDGAIEAELRIADAHRDKGEPDKAALLYEKFLKDHPGHSLFWAATLSQADCYRNLGEQEYQRNLETSQFAANERVNDPSRRAVSAYMAVIDGSPSRSDAEEAYAGVFAIADLYRRDQHWEAAKSVYQMCLEGQRKGQDEVRFRTALLERDRGLLEIQRLRETKRKPPGEIVEGFRKAAEGFLGLISAFPTEEWARKATEAVVTMGDPYKAEQMWDAARAVFQLCLGPAEVEEYTLRDDMQYQVALVDLDEAAYALAKQMERLPDVEGLELSNEFVRAIEALQGFVAAFPKSELVADARGKVVEVAQVYGGYRTWPVAIQVLEKFLKDNPDYPHPEDILLRIAVCHMAKVIKDITAEEIALWREVPPPPAAPVAVREQQGREVARPGEPISHVPAAGPAGPGYGGYGGYGGPTTEGEALAARAARMQQAEQQRFVQMAMAQPAVQGGARPTAVSEVVEKEQKERAEAFEQARAIFQKVMNDYPQTAAAAQARAQISRMVQHLESQGQWEEAVAIYGRFLKDNPNDKEITRLTFQIAVCLHNLANAEQVAEDDPKAALEAFDKARAAYRAFLHNYPDSDLADSAEFALALTHRDEGVRLAASFPALAAGQYVQAHAQLEEFAGRLPHSENRPQVPGLIYQLGQSLEGVSRWEDAVACYQGLVFRYPTGAEAPGAAERIAQIEKDELDSPLKATNSYLELLWQYRPGDTANIGNTVYGIGTNLQSQRRWVEATAVYEVFVNSFPDHPKADGALKAVGDIYKGNQLWQEAIAAYEKTVEDYPEGDLVAGAELGMAECYENLGQWKKAIAAYEKFLERGGEGQRETVQGKTSILRDIVLYQQLIDQRVTTARLDDAQFQIATIVLEKLQNRVKAIEEFGKVVEKYPDSYVADDAQFKIGTCYRDLDDFPQARENFERLVRAYPDSPLADDAICAIGFSYEEEARRLEEETKEVVAERAYGTAQNVALQQAATGRAGRKEALEKQMKGAEPGAVGALMRFQSQEMDEARTLGERAEQQAAALTAIELANRQDRINAALRSAVAAYDRVVKDYPLGDFADDSLLRTADIYYIRLKDTPKAMAAYELLVRHYPGTALAEEAAGKLGPYYEKEEKWREAIKAYQQYIYNYPQGRLVQDAFFAIPACYEQLEEWVNAMDAYQAFIDRYPDVPRAQKAKDRIAWIKTYRLGRA